MVDKCIFKGANSSVQILILHIDTQMIHMAKDMSTYSFSNRFLLFAGDINHKLPNPMVNLQCVVLISLIFNQLILYQWIGTCFCSDHNKSLTIINKTASLDSQSAILNIVPQLKTPPHLKESPCTNSLAPCITATTTNNTTHPHRNNYITTILLNTIPIPPYNLHQQPLLTPKTSPLFFYHFLLS